ncbi:DUF986 family protein, partial [Rodentibacter trehalosifermentans]|uniref:DUF986 family protein n=1 Tax=Rodentibacter trehalosifermentans TaxID=1908263 RepID=UPI001F605A03
LRQPLIFYYFTLFYLCRLRSVPNGKTKLKVALKKQHKIDALILVALILILVYQAVMQSGHISPITLFFLTIIIILAIYSTFFRTPMLIFKPQGFFYANIYIDYQKIHQLNLTQNHILVIDLTNKKRLFAPLANKTDVQQVINFFGGLK